MGCLVEFFIEFFFEILAEGFVSLIDSFVPQNWLSQKARKIIIGVFAALSVILFFGVFVGIFWLIETQGKSFWGWLPIILSLVYIIIGIVLKLKGVKNDSNK